MKRVVSISPTKVGADSRTFKQAASISRFGYASVVVEGERSGLERSALPFELYSLAEAAPAGNSSGENVAASRSVGVGDAPGGGGARERLKRLSERLGLRRLVGFRHTARGFLRGFSRYLYRNCLLPLRHTPRASLYVLHSPLQFPAVYFLSRRYKAPFIYDAHDFYGRIEESEEHLPLEEHWLKAIHAKVESLCVRKAAAVVTVSEGVAELHEEAFGCRPAVIRNCQDPRLDRCPPQTLRRLLGLPADAFLLVTVGQAKRGQALSEAFDAMRMLPERVHLALVGARYDQHLEEIRGKGLEGRVHVVPPVKPYEVVPFIRGADAALILYYPRSANYANCLPNGFFQAVTAELPLLYPELREIKKLAEQYGLGVAIDPQSAESIRAGVAELLTNRERLLMFKRNLRAARQELSWEKEEILLKDLISRIIG
jgi:glycosyltransferase involved in cell wall biosynthesis